MSFGQNSLLPSSSETFASYGSSIVATLSAQASNAVNRLEQATSDFDAFFERVQGISGVNVDEELALNLKPKVGIINSGVPYVGVGVTLPIGK